MNPVMCVPRLIQRKRTRGWRMPANTVYVGRPSRWGNPYIVGEHAATAPACVALFIERYENDANYHFRMLQELAGKDLACWCSPDAPCHGNVLLVWANTSVCELS